jgi:hypothetical protein
MNAQNIVLSIMGLLFVISFLRGSKNDHGNAANEDCRTSPSSNDEKTPRSYDGSGSLNGTFSSGDSVFDATGNIGGDSSSTHHDTFN